MDGAAPRSVFGDAFGLASQYVDILTSRGIEWGLLGPREVDRVWGRHVLNSVAISPLLPPTATVVDVGSGAGLPGIPLAILRPDLRVTLLEPLQRRFNFLTLAVNELGLGDRVAVVRGRAEDHQQRYEVVTCRALAPLPRLLTWCAPLIAPAGRLVALKGSSATEEIRAAGPELVRLRLRARVEQAAAPGSEESTWVIVAEPR